MLLAVLGESGTLLPFMVTVKPISSYIEPDRKVVEDFSEMLGGSKRPVSRMLFFGDIHGSYNALQELLDKVSYDNKHDRLVFIGDFISKGKQNFEVLDFAIDHKAACVLGNHEIRILKKYASYFGLGNPRFCTQVTANNTCEGELFDNIDAKFVPKPRFDPEMSIAKRLKSRHIDYLTNCSIILELGPVGYGYESKKGKALGDTQTVLKKHRQFNYSQEIDGVAVHGGLQWNLNLTSQDVEVATNIRSLYEPDFLEPAYESRSLVAPNTKLWSKIWNKKQRKLSDWKQRKIVFYGHDASRGLKLKEYSKGLDTSCVTGGQLSAIVLTGKYKKGTKHITYSQKLVQVQC